MQFVLRSNKQYAAIAHFLREAIEVCSNAKAEGKCIWENFTAAGHSFMGLWDRVAQFLCEAGKSGCKINITCFTIAYSGKFN